MVTVALAKSHYQAGPMNGGSTNRKCVVIVTLVIGFVPVSWGYPAW